MKVVYVVEVEVPEEYAYSSMHDAAQAVMDVVRTKTNLPCRAWASVQDTADAVIAAVTS